MTNLKWRLGKLPTVDELVRLVDTKVITQEEARAILFNQSTEEVDENALKEEIKFLRLIIEKLSTKTKTVEVIKEIQTPYYHQPWYRPYTVWCGSSGETASGTNVLTTNAASTNNFSNISTF